MSVVWGALGEAPSAWGYMESFINGSCGKDALNCVSASELLVFCQSWHVHT